MIDRPSIDVERSGRNLEFLSGDRTEICLFDAAGETWSSIDEDEEKDETP